ncbi:hypothetical protein ACFWUZ_01355 [Streptomyces sp. NPDC058646]|uniref:hypothetical protein n=1 Tax=Streptomyces sp. NPDC058646 TaxID=3346574 RepID=UPI003657AD96
MTRTTSAPALPRAGQATPARAAASDRTGAAHTDAGRAAATGAPGPAPARRQAAPAGQHTTGEGA